MAAARALGALPAERMALVAVGAQLAPLVRRQIRPTIKQADGPGLQ